MTFKPEKGVGLYSDRPAEIAAKRSALPWERQVGESVEAYKKFCHYRDLGVSVRTQELVAVKFQTHVRNVAALSSKWRWVERARLWDDDQDRLHRDKMVVARRDASKRHIDQAKAFQTFAIKALQAKYGKNLENIDPTKVSNRDIIAFLVEGVKIERLATGESTENISGVVDGGAGTGSGQPLAAPPAVPLTFEGRVTEAVALLEAARERAANAAAGSPN